MALTGQADRRYVLTLTGRAQDLVVHWAQGPYDVFDETVDVPIELPAELEVAILSGSRGYLTARVVPTTPDGRAFPAQVAGRTPLVHESGRVGGVARERWDEVQGLQEAPAAERPQEVSR